MQRRCPICIIYIYIHTYIYIYTQYRKLVKKLFVLSDKKTPIHVIRYLKILRISFKACAASWNQNVATISTEEGSCKHSLLQFHCVWFEMFLRVLDSGHEGRCELQSGSSSSSVCRKINVLRRLLQMILNLKKQLTSFGKAYSKLK